MLDRTAIVGINFTVQHGASSVYAVVMSVCPFVSPSHARIVSKQQNLGSRKESQTINQGI